MIPNAIEGATRRLGKSQGYLGLAIRDENGAFGPMMLSSWQPTPSEADRIAKGAPVYLFVLGTGHPPVMLEVGVCPDIQDDFTAYKGSPPPSK
jgi:hypothetical protein